MENQFVGAWGLVDFSFCDINGNVKFRPLGNKVGGLLIYTNDGFMSANLGSLERKPFKNNDYRFGKNEEIIEAYNNIISYSGEYQVNDNKKFILHKINMSMFPNWIGQNVKRYFRIGNYNEIIGKKLEGNFNNVLLNEDIFLELSASTLLHNEELLTPKLIWQKLSRE